MVVPSAAISQAAALREGAKRAVQSKRNQVEPEGGESAARDGLRRQGTLSRVFGSKNQPNVLPWQSKVRKFYKKDVVQMIVAVIIILNFLGNILEKSIDAPFGEKHASTWQLVEDVFNYIFCARCRPPAAAARAPRPPPRPPSRRRSRTPLGERTSPSLLHLWPPLAALAPASCAPFLAG